MSLSDKMGLFNMAYYGNSCVTIIFLYFCLVKSSSYPEICLVSVQEILLLGFSPDYQNVIAVTPANRSSGELKCLYRKF